MSRNLRRLVFYLLILVFLVGGALVAFYALGWRLDLETLTPQKVGAIYLRSFPADASITLDGEPVRNKTGFFQAGTLINSLYPKTYTLKLTAPNYRDWERSVEVEPALVSEVKYAVLVPREASRVIAEKVRNFWLIGEEPLVQSASSTLILQDQTLAGTEVIGWTNDFTRILAKDGKKGTYHWNDLANETSTELTALLRRGGIRLASTTELVVDRENANQILIHNTTSLAIFDLQRNTVSGIASTTAPLGTSTRPAAPQTVITDSAISRFWIGWSEYRAASGTSQIFLYDKFFGTRRSLDPLPGRTVEMKWANNVLGFFQDNGKFYYFAPGAERPQHLADDVRYFEFTPGADMVATLGGQNLEVFSLREEDEYWRYDNIPEPRKITKLTWFRDGQHIFVSYAGATSLLELDDLKLENMQRLAQTDKIHYDPEANELYYLENEALMRLAFPE